MNGTPEIDGKSSRYVIISPVKDEERYVARTLGSVVKQSVQPALWVIVDDGSSDRTREIIQEFADAHSFIQLVESAGRGQRQPGSAVINAFNRGLAVLKQSECDYEFIVKLDCDLSFGPEYFGGLLDQFTRDERLGIASGVYLESHGGEAWTPIKLPSYHAAGASKVVRRSCFEEIGGFEAVRGWDTIDEIRAMTRGWSTTHFPEWEMKHWKIEGTGIGPLRTNLMHGEIYYLTGGSKLFFLLKAVHRLGTRPYFMAAGAMVWGYVKAMLRRTPLLVTREEARHYRSLLRSRLLGRANAA